MYKNCFTQFSRVCLFENDCTPNTVCDLLLCFFGYLDRRRGQLFVQPITDRDSVGETCLETRSRSSIFTFILHHGLKLKASGINLELSIMCQKLCKERGEKTLDVFLHKDYLCTFF